MESLNVIIEAPLKLLGRHEVKVVIVGGAAASLLGSAQLTNDLYVVTLAIHRILKNWQKPFNPFTLDCEAQPRIFH